MLVLCTPNLCVEWTCIFKKIVYTEIAVKQTSANMIESLRNYFKEWSILNRNQNECFLSIQWYHLVFIYALYGRYLLKIDPVFYKFSGDSAYLLTEM